MPKIEIVTEGTGGAFDELGLYRKNRVVELPQEIPIRAECLDEGMSTGKPSIAFILELPYEHLTVIAETSVKLFQMAAYATLAKYGDLTTGGMLGTVTAGKAELRFTEAVVCAGCGGTVPATPYCPLCGRVREAAG